MSDDFYHDDPIEEIPRSKLRSQLLTTGAVIIGSIFFFQSTFAGNISLNSGRGIEFGQGISQAVACSGNTDLTLTPRSSFTNGSPGAHYLQSVIVSNIPTSCYGADFTISAYNDSSNTPLALFNTSTTSAVIYNNAGTFSPGIRSCNMTVASSTGTFTATFTTPVAQSSNVFKLTIQSGAHSVYKVGDRGPGCGLIYYVNDAGFDCGATYSVTGSPTGGKCNYLEVAPSSWYAGGDPTKAWATGTSSSGNASTDMSSITNDAPTIYNNISAVGLGYKNSLAIVAQNGAYPTNDYAAGAARAYAGGSKSDWYLPTTAELNLLCQWARGVSPSVTTACTGGTTNSATYGAGTAGFTDDSYWSSSEFSAIFAWGHQFSDGHQGGNYKYYAWYVRPVRAF